MELVFKNITGNSEKVLVDFNDTKDGHIPYFSFCNKHQSDATTIDLYLYNTKQNQDNVIRLPGDFNDVPLTENRHYLLENVELTIGNTLFLNETDFPIFNNSEYQVKIQLSNSDSNVDIIMRQNVNNTDTVSNYNSRVSNNTGIDATPASERSASSGGTGY